MFEHLKIRVECMYECLNTCKFNFLNAYMNAQWFDFRNWSCIETRGSLLFVLTLYWDERVVNF